MIKKAILFSLEVNLIIAVCALLPFLFKQVWWSSDFGFAEAGVVVLIIRSVIMHRVLKETGRDNKVTAGGDDVSGKV